MLRLLLLDRFAGLCSGTCLTCGACYFDLALVPEEKGKPNKEYPKMQHKMRQGVRDKENEGEGEVVAL